jgi:hypothetical protein
MNNIFVTSFVWLANVIYFEGWMQMIRKALGTKMTQSLVTIGYHSELEKVVIVWACRLDEGHKNT